MNPLRVRARNYRSFEQLDLDLPTGATVIVGPNGAGKSSLVNLIDVALFAGRGELGSDQVRTIGADSVEIVLEFEHAGELYRVRRCLRGTRTTLDLERATFHNPDRVDVLSGDRPWTSLTREDSAATQAEIEEILGLTRETFRAGPFMRQLDGSAFTGASPAKAKEIIGEILQLGVFDLWTQQVRDLARAVEQEIAALDARIGDRQTDVEKLPGLEGRLTTLQQVEDAAVKELAQAEKQLEDAQAAVAANTGAADRIRACQAELATAEEQHARALAELEKSRAAVVALPEQTRALDTATQIAATVPVLEQRLDEARTADLTRAAAQRERDDLTTQAGALDDTLEQLDTESEELGRRAIELRAQADELEQHAHDDTACEACGQPLSTPEARAKVVAGLREQADTAAEQAEAKAKTLQEQLQLQRDLRARAAAVQIPADVDVAAIEAELATARDAERRKPELELAASTGRQLAARLGDLEISEAEANETLTQKRAALEEAQTGAGDPETLTRAVASARAWIEQERGILDQARQERARVEADVARLRQVEQEIAATKSERELRASRLHQLRLGERAFGRDGIPALIVENTVPAIEAEANRMLELMPTAAGTVFRLELRTQRDLRSRDGKKETLDVLVHEPRGVRDFSSYSGGEQMRINLAIRAALTRLLAGRRGAESRALIIDEPTGLDAEGLAQLPDMLQGLLGEFDRILLASPDPSLRGAFEREIELVNEAGVSRIVGAREAVVA